MVTLPGGNYLDIFTTFYLVTLPGGIYLVTLPGGIYLATLPGGN